MPERRPGPQASLRHRLLLFVPPAIVAVAFAIVILRGRSPTACPETSAPLGDVAEGPHGYTALGRYDQWAGEGGRCEGRLAVAVYPPGGSWEDEAWTPAVVPLRAAVLPEPARAGAWLEWEPEGKRIALGFGERASLVVVDAYPGSTEPGRFRACRGRVVPRTEAGGIDWAAFETPADACEVVVAE